MSSPQLPHDRFRPDTAYNESFEQDYGWAQASSGAVTGHQQMVPYPRQGAGLTAQPGSAGHLSQRDKDRRAMTTRIIVALVLAVPLTAIAASEAGVLGLIIAWMGISGVVGAGAITRRRDERDDDDD